MAVAVASGGVGIVQGGYGLKIAACGERGVGDEQWCWVFGTVRGIGLFW